MSIDAWTQTPAYTISGIGPYAITHPYNLGAIFAFVMDGSARIELISTLFTLVPEATNNLGSLFLTPEAAATYGGKRLIIDRQTPDEQGWQAVIGEREAGLEAQLNRMVMAGQELRATIAGAVRTRDNLEVFDWPDGTVPLRAGTKVIAGPTASQIANAQAFADQTRSDATAAAASAATALAKENSMLRLRGPWTPGMTLTPSDIVGFNGSQYDCVIPHVAVNFAADLAAGRLRLFLAQGAPGAGAGDMLAQNFGTEYSANAAVFRSNVGLAIGREIPQLVAGQVEFFLTGIVPERYLELNGQTVSRTTYNLLFAAIGSISGPGDGSTTFTLPDMRGLFPRVIQAGRALGSIQEDALQSHIHGLNGNAAGASRVLSGQTARVMGVGDAIWTENFSYRGAGGGRHVSPPSNPDGTASGGINPVRTDFETRPRNMAVMACVCVGPLPTPPAVLLPPEAIGTINAQFFTQNVAITPINLGAFFSGPPTSITISPATPGLTIGPSPSFLLSGTPTTGRATTLMTVTASRGAGTATQTFTTLIAVPGSTGRADVENLRYGATPNGRTSTAALKRIGTDAVPTGWSVSGNIVSVNAPFTGDIENWDFTGKTLAVYTPIGAVRQNLFGETIPVGIAFYVNVFVGGRISILEYNDFTGPFRDGNASAAIKQQNDGGSVARQIGEIPIIRFNRLTGLSFDAIKAAGSYDVAGQVIEWNYFGAPVNLPQTPALVWSAAVTYTTGQYVKDAARNQRTMISRVDGNTNNLVPTNAVSNTFWTVLDPHADAITTESAIVKIKINNNLIDWTKDPEGVLGPYINGGLTNAFRLSRNSGTSGRFDAVEVTGNVVRWGQVDQPSTPIQVSDGGMPNFNGPVSFTNNWMDSTSGGTYFHPSTNGLVNVWSGNRNAITDALITGPTLRGGGVAPANAGGVNAPAVTGGTTAGSTLNCTTGTWTGDATITYAYQWEVNGVAVSGATASTFVAPVGAVNCDVTATNASGSVSITSNIVTIGSAGTVTVDSASLKMPDGNMSSTFSGAPAYLADAANWAGSGAEIFAGGTGAFAMMIEIPWEQIKMTSGQYMGLFGNISSTGTNTLIMGINIVRGVTDQEAYTLTFRLRDGLGNILLSNLTVTKDQKRLLCVFRYQAGAIQHEIYHNGTRIANAAPAMGTFVGTTLRSGLLYGAQGTGTGTAFTNSASMFGFIGSIAYFGYHNTGLTQADCEAMSLGVDPLTQVIAANWRMYRRLIDTELGSLEKPAAATGDATAALTVINTRALTFRKGSNLLPSRVGANWIDHTPILDGKVFGRINGSATGRIYLAGRASGVTGLIEARSFDAVTGDLKQDWTTVIGSTIAAGLWAGYIDAPKNIGWGHIDVRAASTPAMVSRIRARTGVGLVMGLMGQSQNARCWEYTATGIVDANAGALSTIDVTGRTATAYGLISAVITGERVYSGALAAVANVIKHYTTEPVMFMNLSNPGQGPVELQSDANTAWNWSEMEALLTQAIGPFAQRRGIVVIFDWLTNFANNVNAAGNGIIGNNIQPLLDGTFAAGATTFTVDHFLRDNLTFPLATTVYAVSPPCVNMPTTAGPFDFSGTSSSPANHGAGRGQWITYAAGQGMVVGPFTDDLDMSSDGGGGAGGPHQNTLRFEGNPRHLMRKAIAGLWAMGLNPKTNPSLGGAVRSGGGAVFTIASNRPNGGVLQTGWGFKAIAVPTGQTSAQGFEVQDGGIGAWSRSTFTTALTGGNVVLTKITGSWAANTKIRYNANGPLDYGTSLAASFLYNGALYESGPEESGLGLPIAGLWTATV